MIFPSNRVRIMVASKPVDFRKAHDGLAALDKNELHKDPFTGTVFVFRSRKADRLKLIYWDGSGLVMAYKQLKASAARRLRKCVRLGCKNESLSLAGWIRRCVFSRFGR